MKTRNGFVSNSSSSSFVILARTMSFYDVECAKKLKNVYCMNECGMDGFDFFHVDSEIRKFLKQKVDGGYYFNDTWQFYEVFYIGCDVYEYGEEKLTKKDILKIAANLPENEKFGFMAVEKCNHSCQDVGDIEDKYFTKTK